MTESLTEVRDTHLGRMLLKLERKFTKQVLEKLASDNIKDITLRHFVVIPYVDHKGIRAIEIAKQAGISKQAVSKLVDELVNKGYLELKPDPTDGRASLVYMSSRGHEFLELALKYTRQIESQWADKVGKKDFLIMKSAMTTLLEDPA
jgi:DNA-binding MarR family transcriptional regulator